MNCLSYICIGAFLLAVPCAWAKPQEIYAALKTSPVGSARMTWGPFNLYDATLYAPDQKWSENKPFVLELKYLRDLSGRKIADASVDEMKRVGYTNEKQLQIWADDLARWFGDVGKNTRLAGIRNPDGSTSFIKNGNQYLGTIQQHEFGDYFFDIWLSDASRRPDLAKALKGKNNETEI